MKIIACLCALFLSLVAPTLLMAGDIDPDGGYRGVGMQNNGAHWLIEVIIADDGAVVSYGQLDCNGVWRLSERTEDHVDFIEVITTGTDNCIPLGVVRISKLSGDNLLYTWFTRGGPVEARGVLIPAGGTQPSYLDLLQLTLSSVDLSYMDAEFLD